VCICVLVCVYAWCMYTHHVHNVRIDFIIPQLSWAGETKALLSSDELGKDVRSAEEMSEKHQELKLEIDNNEEKYVPQGYF